MRNMNIEIKQIDDLEKRYVAYAKSDFLNATYAVFFGDNILGSVALNKFSEMMKFKFDVKKIDFVISCQKITFNNPAILDVMTGNSSVLKLPS